MKLLRNICLFTLEQYKGLTTLFLHLHEKMFSYCKLLFTIRVRARYVMDRSNLQEHVKESNKQVNHQYKCETYQIYTYINYFPMTGNRDIIVLIILKIIC